MANFVIVHGAWGGAWEWTFVTRRLRDSGHAVLPVTLTGLGDRAHLGNADVTLATHVQDVVAVLEMESLTEVILCGHSYGGLVVTQATATASERIAATLYLDGLVPEVGESLFDLLPEDLTSILQDKVRDNWAVDCPFRYSADGAMTAELADWYNARHRPQPLRTLTDPVTRLPATDRRYGYVSFIDGEHGQATFLTKSAERAQSRGWWTATVDGIHDAQVTNPADVVAVIEEFATRCHQSQVSQTSA